MTHAGRSVIVSGSTVAVGLLSMIVLPLPFIRSMGIGGMLIPAVSVLAAITLLPALLAVLGTRINSVRVMPKRFVDHGHPEDGAWGRWARFVLRRPVPVALVGLAIVGVLAGIGMQLNPNESQLKNFPGTGTAIAGRAAARRGRHQPGRDEAVRRARRARRQRAGDRGEARAPCRASSARRRPPRWQQRRRLARRGVPGHRRRRARDPGDHQPRQRRSSKGTDGTLGGVAAVDRDFVHAIYGNFPYVLAFVMILTLILLARAFRSIVLRDQGGDPEPRSRSRPRSGSSSSSSRRATARRSGTSRRRRRSRPGSR